MSKFPHILTPIEQKQTNRKKLSDTPDRNKHTKSYRLTIASITQLCKLLQYSLQCILITMRQFIYIYIYDNNIIKIIYTQNYIYTYVLQTRHIYTFILRTTAWVFICCTCSFHVLIWFFHAENDAFTISNGFVVFFFFFFYVRT